MDALAIRALTLDWNERFMRARVEKIHQPSPRELVLTVRTRTGTARLLLSAHKAAARAHTVTKDRPQNPEEPPAFCMLARRRIESGRIVRIYQPGWDRALCIVVETLNDIGDTVYYALVLETMGKHSNLMLTEANRDGTLTVVVDSVVHVTEDMSRVRQVLPGRLYTSPPPLARADYQHLTPDLVRSLQLDVLQGKRRALALCSVVAGLGPLTAAEALHRADETGGDAAVVVNAVRDLFERVLNQSSSPTIGLDELGIPVAAAPFELTSAVSWTRVDRLDTALETVYAETNRRIQQTALAADMERLILQHMDRLRGKRQKLQEQAAESENHDDFRLRGELLTAFVHQVQKGLYRVELPNYYHGDELFAIDLDPALSPMENAQRYFRLASKKKRAIPLIAAELGRTNADLTYLEGVLALLGSASREHYADIRQELVAEGFMKPERTTRKPRSKPPKTLPQQPDVYVSSDGLPIRVGRNNLHNDRLTLRQSQPQDVWLHVKDQPGSHVVVGLASGTALPESTLHEAALLAAYFSKGKDSANVAVDYTAIRHVWKPNGARPGHVLYDQQKTLFVTPDRSLLAAILARQQYPKGK